MIYLNTYLPLNTMKEGKEQKYKFHYMVSNGHIHPYNENIEVLQTVWQNWKNEENGRNRWGNADYIFTLLQIPPPEKNIWLFLGIFKILSNLPDKNYETTLTDKYDDLVGRLKVYSDHPPRPVYPYVTNSRYSKLTLYEITKDRMIE